MRPFLEKLSASEETPTTSRSPNSAARFRTRTWPTCSTSKVPNVITVFAIVRFLHQIVAADAVHPPLGSAYPAAALLLDPRRGAAHLTGGNRWATMGE